MVAVRSELMWYDRNRLHMTYRRACQHVVYGKSASGHVNRWPGFDCALQDSAMCCGQSPRVHEHRCLCIKQDVKKPHQVFGQCAQIS